MVSLLHLETDAADTLMAELASKYKLHPAMYDSGAYQELLKQKENYIKFGNQNGEEASKTEGFRAFVYDKPEDFVNISEEGLNRAKKQGLLKNKEARVIYPPVDINKFLEIPSKKGEYFLYVSRFNPPKRQDLLVKAWIEFSKEYPNEKLILTGGLENKKYFEYVKSLSKEFRKQDLDKINKL
jgi:glycosyltransferase involved in cell wall biosynthesis